MRRGSAALDAILTAPGGESLCISELPFSLFSAPFALSPDVNSTPGLHAPNPNSAIRSTASSDSFSTTPLRHEDVDVALENEPSASGRRTSLNPTQGLAMPLFSSMKVHLSCAKSSRMSSTSYHGILRCLVKPAILLMLVWPHSTLLQGVPVFPRFLLALLGLLPSALAEIFGRFSYSFEQCFEICSATTLELSAGHWPIRPQLCVSCGQSQQHAGVQWNSRGPGTHAS